MEKNSPIYNNKRFSQRTDNYQDYERNKSIPAPASGQGFLGLGNTNQLYGLGIAKASPFRGEDFYSDSISNAKAFDQSSIYSTNPKFKEEISKFISYIKMLNDSKDSESDRPKNSWLENNKNSLDQYNEFTNWSQSERQKYSSRFNTMLGTKRGAILQKALIALKNAEIAAAKFSFQDDQFAQNAEYMSDGAVIPDKSNSKVKPSPASSPASSPVAKEREQSSLQPEKPLFNYEYFKSIRGIKNANDLVYHSAKKALNLRGVQDIDSYYTKKNYKTIEDEITKIADSSYMNKLNSSLRGLKDKALEILFNKTGLDVEDTSEVAPEKAGSMDVTRGQDGEQKVHSPVETEAGAEVKRLLDVAEDLENEQLKMLWKNMLININSLLKNPQIDSLERVDFEQRIKDIQKRYYLAFNPQGGQQTSSGKFFAYRTEDLGRLLEEALEIKDVITANDLVNKLKVMFYDSRGWQPDLELKTKLKQKIKIYNFKNPEQVENFK